MPRILIIGATGYLGSALASELLKSGNHYVYGLARNSSKATQLAAKEIIPVIGSVTDSAAYLSLIKTAGIHIVVDTAGANDGSAKILEDLVTAGKERLREGGPKLGFVYTSGMWVHGSSYDPISDLDPVGQAGAKSQPPRMVAWRPQLERQILAVREVLDAMILRPAMMYGRESTFWGPFFGPIVEAAKSNAKTVGIPLDPNSMPALAHVDDVASGFRCAIEKLPQISGTSVYPVFDFVTSWESLEMVVKAAARNFHFEGDLVFQSDESNVYAEAIQTTINGSSLRAKQILGWQPKRYGMAVGMEVYSAAWQAGSSVKQ